MYSTIEAHNMREVHMYILARSNLLYIDQRSQCSDRYVGMRVVGMFWHKGKRAWKLRLKQSLRNPNLLYLQERQGELTEAGVPTPPHPLLQEGPHGAAGLLDPLFPRVLMHAHRRHVVERQAELVPEVAHEPRLRKSFTQSLAWTVFYLHWYKVGVSYTHFVMDSVTVPW